MKTTVVMVFIAAFSSAIFAQNFGAYGGFDSSGTMAPSLEDTGGGAVWNDLGQEHKEEALKRWNDLSHEDKKEAIDTWSDLSPEEKGEAMQRWNDLSQDDKEEALRRWKDLTPEERQQVLTAARNTGVRVMHIPEGPDIPRSKLVDFDQLRSSIDVQNIDQGFSNLFAAAKQYMPQLVVFRQKPIDQYSDNGHGNGILIDSTRILTSAHVAAAIVRDPAKFRILRIGRPEKNFLQPLKHVSTQIIATTKTNTGDPDLAVIEVEPVSGVASIPLSEPPPPSRGGYNTLVSLGSAELQLLPSAGTGIVTTTTELRELGDFHPALRRTVFGTSLRVFPGLSGAPVFDANGALVGIVTGGWKKYSGTGEHVIKVEASQQWVDFAWWTWVTPVNLYSSKLATTSISTGGG